MNKRKRKQVLIATIDVLLMYLSLFLALYLRKGTVPSPHDWQIHAQIFTFIFLWWLACFYTAGLYNLAVVFDRVLLMRRLVMSAIIAALGTVALFYVYKAPGISPKTVLLLFSLFVVGFSFSDRLFYSRIQTKFIKKLGIAYVGEMNNSVREIIAATRNLQRLNFEFRALLCDRECDGCMPENVAICVDEEALAKAVHAGEINLIVTGHDNELPVDVRTHLFDFLEDGAGFIGLFDFYEQIFRKIPLDDIDETWFIKNIDLMSKKPYITIKRLLDVTLALILFLISLPFWPFIALAILIDSRGPVFFFQTRIGRFSAPFRMVKFRTMKVEGNHAGPTTSNDTRITPLGRILRKTRLDEIPQLLNVLLGDMSFVGPRPERPELVDDLEREIPYYRQRLLVKPGVTGWDQVSGEYHSPSREDTFKKLQADLYYVKNFSMSLDFSIFFKTIFTVLRASGR